MASCYLQERERERRKKLRQRLETDFDQTILRVWQAGTSKRSERKSKFCKPHWPPVISPEESERRRRFRKSLGRESSPQDSLCRRQWPPVLKNVKVSVPPCASLAVLPPTTAVADTALKRVPRTTVWRRKKRAEEDKKALMHGKAIARRAEPKRFTCRLCGQPKRLEFGHSFYKGKSFCATSAGNSVTQWLSEQKRMAGTDNLSNASQTTASRWKKPRKPYTCQLCQQPKTKHYGHSRYAGKTFCSTYEGKTVELWLTEQRALSRIE
ncbi:uncharacterized protein LOC113106743 [Carassius auratus]|uniref:Uncharacterized protein LOC113106743 n=1 Tax=Carassius auratus TaxID=7957 RepID=A0A6P6PUT4_CARAU|nr:uncharacterized protein LOC113106743 [Carassius auratus]